MNVSKMTAKNAAFYHFENNMISIDILPSVTCSITLSMHSQCIFYMMMTKTKNGLHQKQLNYRQNDNGDESWEFCKNNEADSENSTR